MKKRNTYDSALHMFVQEPRDADQKRLAFLRWLAENGRLEHEVAGPATGSYLVAPGTEPDSVEAAA